MTVAQRIYLLFALVAVGLAGMVGLGAYQIGKVYIAANYGNEHGMPALTNQGFANDALTTSLLLLGRHVLTTDATEMTDIEKDIATNRIKAKKAIEDYRPLITDDEDRKIWEAEKAGMAEIEAHIDQVITLSRANKKKEAIDLLMKNRQWMDRIGDFFDDSGALNSKSSQEQANYASTLKNITIDQFIVIALLLFASIFVMGLLIVRNLLRQLGGEPAYAAEIAQKVAAGDLAVNISTKKGDTSSLLFNIKVMVAKLAERSAQLTAANDELSIAAVTFNAQDGVIVTDENHTILKVNQSFTAITGYTSEEVIGKTPAILQSGRQDKEFYRQMKIHLENNKFWQGEIWNRRKDGEIYPEWLTITSVTGEKGNTHYVGIFSDITKRKAYEDKISFLAYHDKLTQLPSREMFYDSLSQAMSQVRRKQDRLALFYLDLDGFKAVNDTHGHEAGDEVLKTTAHRLSACIRDVDAVARLGGDEFAIVLSGIATSVDAISVAEKVIKNLSEPLKLQNGIECEIGVSIGIAIYPENGVEIDRLMSAADSAMYESKAAGKNTYTFSRVQAHWDIENQSWIVLDRGHIFDVPELDQDHLGLANTLNELNAAVMNNEPTGITAQLLIKLTTQIQTHFRNEERLMDQYGYFNTDTHNSDEHKKEHQRLINELGYLRDKFYSGGEMVVLHSLKEWLLNHISSKDRQLSELISKERAK